ncbi:MAG: hypothetical protein ACR2OA_11345 [Rubripirellula sp.]
MVGYDVARCLFGVRYINYEELYAYNGENDTAGGITPTIVGSITSETKNHLIGPQVGIDLLYPICRRGYTGFRTRAGVFANFADMDFDLRNNLDTALFANDDTITVSGLLEIAGGLRFQVTDCISIRAGGELWWLGGVATATDQFRNTIGGINGVRTGSDFFVAGGTLGAEFRYWRCVRTTAVFSTRWLLTTFGIKKNLFRIIHEGMMLNRLFCFGTDH